MKKITSKKVQRVILRSSLILSGTLATAISALFCNSAYSVAAVIIIGSGLTCLIDECINK